MSLARESVWRWCAGAMALAGWVAVGTVTAQPPQGANAMATWPMFRGRAQRTGTAAGAPAPPWALAWKAQALCVSAHTSPALSGDLVFCAGSGVMALDKTTGQRRWRHARGISQWSSPALAEGRVYVTSLPGTMTALDASHTRRW